MSSIMQIFEFILTCSTGADLGGGCRGVPPPSPKMTCGFLIQLVFCKKIKNYVVYWCWSRARGKCTPPRKIPGPAPALMPSSPIMPKHICLLFQKPHQSPGLRYGSSNLKLWAFLCIIYFKFIPFSPKIWISFDSKFAFWGIFARIWLFPHYNHKS